MSTPVIKTEEVILENVEYNSAEELDDELQLQLEDSGGESYQYQSDGQTIVQPQHIVMKTSRQRQISNMNQGGAKQTSGVNASSINNKSMDSEKRMRREIANSNERRRMQSINAGFQNLRSLLPRHEGEKLSKAAILQQTSAYICELENQKTQLLSQNSQLKRQLGHQEPGGGGSSGTCNSGAGDVPCNDTTNVKKRKLTDNVVSVQTISDSSDEGVGSMSPEPMTLLTGATASVVSINNSKAQMFLAQNAAKEILDLKEQLYKETRLRTALEEELQGIKRQLITVATAPQPTVVTEVMDSGATTYIPREVIEHTDNLLRDDCGPFTYVEIDELTGQEHMVVCSSVEELDSDAAAAAEIITEDNVHEEVILSSTSSTESEQESAVSAIAKVYAEGNSPSSAILQPILQAAIKATPKVEVERITDATLKKVKTEKIEQTSGLTRSRQNLETIVEAIRHLEGDHLFTDGTGDQHKVLVAQAQQHVATVRGQETPLALTTKQNVTQRKTLAELRPFLQIKGGNKQVTIVGGGTTALTLSKTPCTAVVQTQKDKIVTKSGSIAASAVTPTAIFKVQTTSSTAAGFINSSASCSPGGNVTITTTALKQCRPGVIVAKQLS